MRHYGFTTQTSSMKISPPAPAAGAARLPSPMYIFVTALTSTPAAVNSLNGTSHRLQVVRVARAASVWATKADRPALSWSPTYNGSAALSALPLTWSVRTLTPLTVQSCGVSHARSVSDR